MTTRGFNTYGGNLNIFVVSDDFNDCAVALDDKRLVKMCLESAQMLSTAVSIHGGSSVYRAAWHKHPCTIWTAETRSNFEWHVNLLRAMGKEYEYRYGKVHKSVEVGMSLVHQSSLIPSGPLTEFANCSLYKEHASVIEAYRQTMIDKWHKDKRPPKWTNRLPPNWAKV
jgi:hypothetical protein